MTACICDWDPPTLYHCATRTARIAHRCAECGGAIRPGELYEHVFGIWEGRPDTFDTCPRCLELRGFVMAHVPCLCWQHGNMREDCIETARAYAPEAPGLLFGAWRREIAINRRVRGA